MSKKTKPKPKKRKPAPLTPGQLEIARKNWLVRQIEAITTSAFIRTGKF